MVCDKGGEVNGPAVWPRATSLAIAFVTCSWLSLADLLLGLNWLVISPL